jgi:hypothetical protein
MFFKFTAANIWWVKRHVVFALLVLAISGCTQLRVTYYYYSEPEGADIILNGVNYGTAPGRMTLQGGYAQWKSGATSRKETFNVGLSAGRDLGYTFKRPYNAPNAEIDINYANQLRAARLERKRQAEQRRQAEARRAYEKEKLRLERERIDA